MGRPRRAALRWAGRQCGGPPRLCRSGSSLPRGCRSLQPPQRWRGRRAACTVASRILPTTTRPATVWLRAGRAASEPARGPRAPAHLRPALPPACVHTGTHSQTAPRQATAAGWPALPRGQQRAPHAPGWPPVSRATTPCLHSSRPVCCGCTRHPAIDIQPFALRGPFLLGAFLLARTPPRTRPRVSRLRTLAAPRVRAGATTPHHPHSSGGL
jgi:hypothetical protein